MTAAALTGLSWFFFTWAALRLARYATKLHRREEIKAQEQIGTALLAALGAACFEGAWLMCQ